MTDIVERIKVERWTNRDGEDVTSYRVSLVSETGQREVPFYDPRGKNLKEDTPLPEGWEVKTSKAGRPYLAAPKPATSGGFGSSGAPASFRNTKEAFLLEQQSIHRSVALQQAVAIGSGITTELAEKFYAWLRAPESVSAGQGPVTADTPPSEGSAHRQGPERLKGSPDPAGQLPTAGPSDAPPDGAAAKEKGPAPSDTTCQHEWTDAPRKGWRVCQRCRRAVPEGEAT